MLEMNPEAPNSETRLTKALRSMAAASARSAPPEIGDALTQAFRRHHARRRLVRRATMMAAAIIVVLPAVLLVSPKHVVESPAPAVAGPGTAPNTAVAAPRTNVFPATATTSPSHKRRRPVAQRVGTVAHRDDFLPLPSYDLRTQTEDLRIVRLRLNGRSLRLVGAPISAEIDDRAVLADFVIGQDGTPYAVRLLQQNTR
jgi:hypothetical protein